MKRLFLALGLLVASCQPVMAAGVGLTALTPHGAVSATDLVPCQPAAGTTLLSCKMGDITGAIISVKSYGAVGDGTTDDTAAIQAAIDSGLSISCPPGIYKTTATLNFTSAVNNGQMFTGSGATNDTGGTTAGRCIIKPSAAVTTAINVSGTSPTGPWLLSHSVKNLTLDMTNMATGSYGFKEAFEYDTLYENIRVINDTAKHSIYFTTGMELTTLSNFQGFEVSMIGTGVTNPTTLTLINPDINYLNVTSAVNLTIVGGAIQPIYASGYTPIVWVPAGTNLINLPNPTGMYVAKGISVSTAWNLSMEGTDMEDGGHYPTNGSLGCGSISSPHAWNDGTHGCAPLVPVADFDTGAYGINITGGDWVGMYPYNPAGLSSAVNISPSVNTGNAAAGDYHFGYQFFNNLTAQPQSDPATGFNVTNAAGGLIFACTTNATVSASQCGQLSGSLLRGWNTGNTVPTWTLNGTTGALSLYSQTIQPLADGQVLTLNNAAGSLYFVCLSAAATTSAKCETYGGAGLDGWNSGNSALTWSINGNTGQSTFYSSVLKPAADGPIFYLDNAAGTSFMICQSAATIASSFCSVGNGADWRGFSDSSFTIQTYDFDAATGNGTFTGTVTGGALVGPFTGTVGATTPNTGAFTTLAASTSILSTGSGGLGYAVGAGGAVTQATSRTTGVTLNKTTGVITLVSAAGLATYQTFTVTDSAVAATDTVVLSQKSGTDKYILLPTAIAAGSFAITFATTGGTTTEQPVLNFTVIKGAAS